MVFLKQREVIIQKLHFLQQQKQTQDSWSITWRLGRVLAELIYIYSPKNILEIGTSIGFSTLNIASELKDDCHITTIEINESRCLKAKKSFDECGLSGVITTINKGFYDFANGLEMSVPFDFIFLDALQPEYLKVIETCIEKNIIGEKTVVVCDNILSHSYMGDFEENIKKLSKSTKRIDLDSGFLIIHF